jgi:hypothetical protein
MYGLASGNAAGVAIAVVLVAFVFLPFSLVVFLERRRTAESHDEADVDAGLPDDS